MRKTQEEIARGLEKLFKRDPKLRFRFDKEFGVIRYLRGDLAKIATVGSGELRSAGLRLLKKNTDLLGKVKEENLKIITKAEDPHGGLSLTLQHYHGPHKVYGSSIRFHVTKDGVVDTINNRLFPDLEKVPIEACVSADKAVASAQRATKCHKIPEHEPELMVYRHKSKLYLVWDVRLNDDHPRRKRARISWLAGEHGGPERWIVYIDATKGRVLFFYNDVKTAGPVSGSGTGYYSAGTTVNAWYNNITYQMRDTTRTSTGGPEVVTDDEDGASPSEDANNNWSDLTTSPRHQNQGAEVDTHRFVGNAVDYYQTVHGRNSIDGSGCDVPSTVHYLTDYDNAYWNGSRLLICDGSGAAPGFDYLCTDDIVAHELTHGVTQHTCNLQYLNESGALNEAFSDIMAAFVTGNWLIGEDCWLSGTAPAMRNMTDPNNGGQYDPNDPINSVLDGHQPSHYDDLYTGTSDYGGVHINNGIINHLFYLLTMGGIHATSGVTVIGIGQNSAELLLYRCMSVNLVGNPTATFLDFREVMLDACLDLFPTDLVKLTQVKNAFNAVGIGPDIYVRDNVSDTGEEPYPGSYLYASPDIINCTSPSSDPATDFADLSNDTLWENVEYGQDNYVYVRLQNRGNQTGDDIVNVYFISMSAFASPASWIHIGTLMETGITPGSLRIAGPLTFPASLIPSPGHYCMIAVVTDPLDPAPDHTLITSVSDYLDFVRNTNNIAYRNMDVVGLVPGTPMTVETNIGTLPGLRERYDLRIDVAQFVPGARILVRGPARILDGAIARGLKLVARKNGENLYRIIIGRELARHREFLYPEKWLVKPEIGFDNVLVDKDFKLAVECVAPEKGELRKFEHMARRKPYELAIRQLWKGEVIGRAAFQIRPQRKK